MPDFILFDWICMLGFYGTSTIVGYLMPNPLYHIYQPLRLGRI